MLYHLYKNFDEVLKHLGVLHPDKDFSSKMIGNRSVDNRYVPMKKCLAVSPGSAKKWIWLMFVEFVAEKQMYAVEGLL